jgi:hypothetical protein
MKKRPGFAGLAEAGDGGENVNGARGHAQIELGARSGEISLGHAKHGDAENDEGPHELVGVLRRGFQPDVEVLGVAGLGVMNHRVAARHEIANITLV